MTECRPARLSGSSSRSRCTCGPISERCFSARSPRRLSKTTFTRKPKPSGAMHLTSITRSERTLERAVWEDLLSISPLDVKKVRLPARSPKHANMPTIEEGRAFLARPAARRPNQCAHLVSLQYHQNDERVAFDVRRHELRRNVWPSMGVRQFHRPNGYGSSTRCLAMASVHGKLKDPKAPSRHRYIRHRPRK